MRPASNNGKVMLTMDRDVEKQARKLAEIENRTFSNFVETVLKKYIAAEEKRET